MGRYVLVLVVALAGPPDVSAAYVQGGREWALLSAAGKIAWATGFVDGAFSLNAPGDVQKRHLLRCLTELGVSGAEVARLVEYGYKDARNMDLPAAIVAWSGIRRLCLGKVNRYRNETGLRPLDP